MANCKLLPPSHPFSPLSVAMFNEGKFLHFEILRPYGCEGGLPASVIFVKQTFLEEHTQGCWNILCYKGFVVPSNFSTSLYQFKIYETIVFSTGIQHWHMLNEKQKSRIVLVFRVGLQIIPRYVILDFLYCTGFILRYECKDWWI